MSHSLIVDVLLHGLAVAMSPEAVVSVLLILLTAKAKTNSLAYMVGWVAGLAVVAAVILGFDDVVAGAPDQIQKPTLGGAIRLAFGILLLSLAVLRWRRRAKRAGPPTEPRWLAVIERFGPVRCFAWGFFLSGINPKNVALTATGAVHFSIISRLWQTEVIAIAGFVVLASTTIAAPVVLFRVMGERSHPRLHVFRAWLIANSDAVIMTLLTIFGMKLIADGIDNLAL